MNQKAQPRYDISNSGWTPQGVVAQIGERQADDTTYVQSGADPQGDLFEVKFPPLAWPQVGAQTLTVRMQQTDVGTVPVTVLLMQGSQLIAGKNVRPGRGFANQSLLLTQDQVNQITDYTDLRLRVRAGYSVAGGCCTNRLPELLIGTITNKSGVFTCLPDSIQFLFQTALSGWNWDPRGVCGVTASNLLLRCNGTDCTGIKLYSGASAFGAVDQAPDTNPACSCDPVNLVYTVSTLLGLGSGPGGYTLTVTE